jgi:L-asparaginase II
MTDTLRASTTEPLDTSGVAELAVLERSGMIESRHLGAAVVLAADGSVLREIGDAGALIYPRSSIKPVQAIALMRSGVQLAGEHAAIASSSHAGTAEHVRVVGELLTRAGLTETDLRCPGEWPADPAAAAAARVSGVGPRRITMNCSGKHAAFLLACVVNGWSVTDYLEPSHPLQQHIRSTIEEFTGEGIRHLGTDGCGAPLVTVSLRGLARAIGRIARTASEGTDLNAKALASAIRANAWAIDGPGRTNTVVVDELGLLCKGGAEGVTVMATPDGRAVAVKILDGSQRATTLVALHLLAECGAIEQSEADRVIELTKEPVLGGGQRVGELRLADWLGTAAS